MGVSTIIPQLCTNTTGRMPFGTLMSNKGLTEVTQTTFGGVPKTLCGRNFHRTSEHCGWRSRKCCGQSWYKRTHTSNRYPSSTTKRARAQRQSNGLMIWSSLCCSWWSWGYCMSWAGGRLASTCVGSSWDASLFRCLQSLQLRKVGLHIFQICLLPFSIL